MFVFFHLCDHSIEFKGRKIKNQKIELKNTTNRYVQRITKGAIVDNIVAVIVHAQEDIEIIDPINYDEKEDYDIIKEEDLKKKGFYDSENEVIADFTEYIESGEPIPSEYYERYLHNRIKWHVKPPTHYTVIVDLTIQGDFKTKLDASDCEVCQGNGWYVDIVDTKTSFYRSRGNYKIIQNVIKDLLTKIGSSRLELSYGQRLHLFPQENYDEERFIEDIQIEVKEVERKYITRQQPNLPEIPPDETLVELQVVHAQLRPNRNTNVVIFLRVISLEEDRVFQFKI